MSIAVVTPSAIRGTMQPPPSKSAAHRALICAALAGGGTVRGILPSDDMGATLRAVSALGVRVRMEGTTARLESGGPPAGGVVDCGESGSTLRFLLPVFAALGISATFTGRGRLPQRPLGVYAGCLPQHGAELHTCGGLPLTISGRLAGGEYRLPGDVSSQFISGLLFALPLCREDSRIILTSPLESAGYVEMTLRALSAAGITVETTADGWAVSGGQHYHPREADVEGDWSQAAFLMAAGALAGEVRLAGLDPESPQGDRQALDLFRRLGADAGWDGGAVRCAKSPLRGIEIDASPIPDLVPVLAVTAAVAEGNTRLYNAGRLRLKESDRLAAVAHCLRLLGARVEEDAEELRVTGVPRLHGGRVPGYGDHRIVMSMAVAALAADGPVTIDGAENVKKSWPSFFEDFTRIGGMVRWVP